MESGNGRGLHDHRGYVDLNRYVSVGVNFP